MNTGNNKILTLKSDNKNSLNSLKKVSFHDLNLLKYFFVAMIAYVSHIGNAYSDEVTADAIFARAEKARKEGNEEAAFQLHSENWYKNKHEKSLLVAGMLTISSNNENFLGKNLTEFTARLDSHPAFGSIAVCAAAYNNDLEKFLQVVKKTKHYHIEKYPAYSKVVAEKYHDLITKKHKSETEK